MLPDLRSKTGSGQCRKFQPFHRPARLMKGVSPADCPALLKVSDASPIVYVARRETV
jgi:hypothetical protein